MTIQCTGPQSVAPYIDANELLEWDSGWESRIDGCWAQKLARSAFSNLGVQAQGDMEVEAISGAAGLLLFASLLPSRKREPLFCHFDRLEDLLTALQALPFLPPLGQVAHYQNEYILFFLCSPSQCAVVSKILAEYGRLCAHHTAYALFLQDQECVIAAGSQLYKLRELA